MINTPQWYADSLARFGLKVITYPAAEPVTLAEAKLHLRLDDDGDSPPVHPDDALITNLISAAREWCEFYAGRSLAPQVLEISGNQFVLPTWQPCCVRYTLDGSVITYNNYIDLPMGPVIAILSVRYLDGDGIEQTVSPADYTLDDYSNPPRLFAAFGFTWPTAQVTANAVKVRYTAGYSLPGDSPDPWPMPGAIRAAILLVLGHLYENREQTTDVKLEQLPLGAQALMERYRLRLGMA